MSRIKNHYIQEGDMLLFVFGVILIIASLLLLSVNNPKTILFIIVLVTLLICDRYTGSVSLLSTIWFWTMVMFTPSMVLLAIILWNDMVNRREE